MGRIAQLGERQPEDLKVSGSLPDPANVCDHREFDPAMEVHMNQWIHRRTLRMELPTQSLPKDEAQVGSKHDRIIKPVNTPSQARIP